MCSVDSSFVGHESNYFQIGNGKSSHCSPSIPELYFTDVPGIQGRRNIQTRIQPQKVKSICQRIDLQIDKHLQNPGLSSTRRLDGKNRPITSIFSFKNGQNPQKVFTSRVSRTITSNELPALRAQFSTEDFRLFKQLDRPIAPRARDSHHSIPRRLSAREPRLRHTNATCEAHNQHSKALGVDDKQQKINHKTMPSYRISRYIMEYPGESKITADKKVSKNKNLDKPNCLQPKVKYKGVAKPVRDYELCQFRYPPRQDKLSSAAKIMHKYVTPETHCKDTHTRSGQDRIEMVASKSRDFVSYTHAPSNTLYSNRRVRFCLGSLHKQHLHFRHVDKSRKISPLQSKRNACHSESHTALCSKSSQSHVAHTMRQQNRSGISKKRRGYEIPTPFKYDVQHFKHCRCLPNEFHNSPYTRHLQCRSRQIIPTSEAARVASPPSSNESNICQMGNPGHRPVRLQESLRSPKVLHSRPPRQESCVSRRFQSELGLSIGMDFSTTISDAKSVTSLKQMPGYIPNSCPEVGTSFLEAGFKESSNRPALDSQELGPGASGCLDQTIPEQDQRDQTGSLAMWGWSEKLKNWTAQQKSLLMSSWRKSTLNTYKPAWSRWVKWADENRISIDAPTGPDLARFLADLHQNEGLSYNTILSHKAVVSTLCSPEFTERLSGHPLVKRILKSISLSKPKNTKSLIWDIDQVISFISKQNPDVDKLYEVSKYTASLLLLTSGRRVHDLTLLSVNSEDCEITDEYIIFWPLFGSKTDSANHRQSGWRLMINKDNKSLDPVHWIKKLIVIGKERRIKSASDNLFITVCGKPRPASRCVIAGWVKKLLKEAGIDAPPGSFRCAVASKSWFNNCSLDEIMARGNWRSENTFKRFYRKEIKDVRVRNPVSCLFNNV